MLEEMVFKINREVGENLILTHELNKKFDNIIGDHENRIKLQEAFRNRVLGFSALIGAISGGGIAEAITLFFHH